MGVFRTFADFEDKSIPLAVFGLPPGVQHWNAIELVLNDFWFMVEILAVEEDVDGNDAEKRWKTLCVGDVGSAISLCSQDYVEKHRLNMVIPTYHDPEQKITIKPVLEILSLEEDGQRSMTVFVASDGTRYVDSALMMKEEEGVKKETLYSKASLDSRAAPSSGE